MQIDQLKDTDLLSKREKELVTEVQIIREDTQLAEKLKQVERELRTLQFANDDLVIKVDYQAREL